MYRQIRNPFTRFKNLKSCFICVFVFSSDINGYKLALTLTCGLCPNVLSYTFSGTSVYTPSSSSGMESLIEKYSKGMLSSTLPTLTTDLRETGRSSLSGFPVVRCLAYRIECTDGCDNAYEIQ